MSNQQNAKKKSGGRGNAAKGGPAKGSNRGNNAQNGNKGGSNQGGDKSKSSNSRRRKGSRKKKVDPQLFWGNPDLLSEYDPPGASITGKPAAVVLSLGRPPLSGQQNAAEHYFTAVYERGVNLASALAAAGELIRPEDLNGDG